MGKYRVLPISMTLKNNKVAKHGDIVDETQLNNPVHELLKDKFIEVVADKNSAAAPETNSGDIVDETTNDELGKLKADFVAAVTEKAELPKDTKPAQLAKAGEKIADLKAKLVEAGVEFDDKGEIVNSPSKS